MKNFLTATVLAALLPLAIVGCTTEVHNHPTPGSSGPTVIKDGGPERVNVNVHDDRGSRSTPEVQNNIKVDR
jgi:hypothetical protein